MSGHGVRAAVVGAGLMGRWHAHALRRCGGRLVAVVDPDVGRAEAVGRRNGCRAVFASLEEVPPALEVDAVHVCTPTEHHEPVLEVAIERGWHALVEKPLAETADATARLLEDARGAGLVVCPVHQFVFQSGVREVVDGAHRMGRLRHVDALACSAGADGMRPEDRDRVVFEILSHPLSLLARLLPQGLGEIAWQVERPDSGELRVQGACGGAGLTVTISTDGRPTQNTLRVIWSAGTAHVDLFHDFVVFESPKVSRTRKILRPLSLFARSLAWASINLAGRTIRGEPAYPGLRELVRRFNESVAAGAPHPISEAEIVAVARARDDIIRGAGELSSGDGALPRSAQAPGRPS